MFRIFTKLFDNNALKTFRLILLIVLCIALIAVSAGFLLPRKVKVERSLIISSSQKSIFSQLNNLKNWANWFPLFKPDPNIKFSDNGTVKNVGASISWISKDKNIGNGSVYIISCEPFNSMLVILGFGENGKSTGRFLLAPDNNNTKVSFCLESDLGLNPVSRWIGLFSDRMIGPELERALYNLDDQMRSMKNSDNFEIINFDVPPHVIISVRDTASPETLTPKLAGMYNKISAFLKFNNLSPTGAPQAVFHNDYTNHFFDIEACIPISKVISVPEGLNCQERPAQKTIMVKYFGSYHSITKAYNSLHSYISDYGLSVTGPLWEEYITNPVTQTDSNKCQTNIYCPILQ